MSLVMLSPPAVEPVAVAEAKAHMRVDGTDEDVLIGSLLLMSRLHIEAALSLALITQSWTVVLDRWPGPAGVDLPLSPLQSVDAIRVKDGGGGITLVPPESYLVDLASRSPRILWNAGVPVAPRVPANGIEIDMTVGFGATAASVPAPLKHAILMLTAHWYEHRDPQEIGSAGARIPDAVSELINPFRVIRL